MFICSQSARDLELYKGIQITRDTIGPSNHVHITLIEQAGYWAHIRIYFFDKKNPVVTINVKPVDCLNQEVPPPENGSQQLTHLGIQTGTFLCTT